MNVVNLFLLLERETRKRSSSVPYLVKYISDAHTGETTFTTFTRSPNRASPGYYWAGTVNIENATFTRCSPTFTTTPLEVLKMVGLRSFTNDWLRSLEHIPEDRAMLARHFGVSVEQVIKTESKLDKQGIDYLVQLPHGQAGFARTSEVSVDMKRRSAGVSHLWKYGTPELGIELNGPLLSDRPLPTYWALYFGDMPQELYVLPCEPLRATVRAEWQVWAVQYGIFYSRTRSAHGYYTTPFIYVPLPVIVASMQTVS